MATQPNDRPVTPLRQRMLDDMALRSMGSRTQHDYVRHVRGFAAFLGRSPDTATAEDVRRFRLHQREDRVGESMINGTVSALRFLFGVTLERPDLSRRLELARRQDQQTDQGDRWCRRSARRAGCARASTGLCLGDRDRRNRCH
jgi:integrase/recombinase XerD